MTPALIALITALFLGFTVFFLGLKKEGYCHLVHTISELGESGSKLGPLVNFCVFLPVSIAMLAVYFLAEAEFGKYLALCIAAGYGIAALFPCDPNAPWSGSWRNSIHQLGGAAEYLGGAVCLMAAEPNHGFYFRIAGFIVGAGCILISWPHKFRGLVQRIVEAALFISLFFLVR